MVRPGPAGDALALAAGALGVAAYAPLGWWPLAVLAPVLLFSTWLEASVARAAWRGFLFGLGFFGLGVSWVFHSIHEFGQAPGWLAAGITAAFILALSGFPAMVGALGNRYRGAGSRLVIAYPALWTLAEWTRGWFLTGFPWLLAGEPHADSPLAGYFPVVGTYAVGWIGLWAAGVLVWWSRRPPLRPAVWLGVALGVVLAAGGWLHTWPWSRVAGPPLEVALVQGNIAQDRKWAPEQFEPTKALYLELTAANWDADLIVWPETAIPAFYSDVRDYFQTLAEQAVADGVTLISGIFRYDPHGRRMYNSLVRLGDPPEFYDKRHLVMFGEYLPLRGLLQRLGDMLVIPMSDLSPGTGRPLLHMLDGRPVGVGICFEDAFGRETSAAFPEAQLLLNVSNDAWFGDSLAPHQHLHIARLRALETRRFMVRATNTGISAVVDPYGAVLTRAPQFETRVLRATVTPLRGETPFVRWGNAPWISAALFVLLILELRRRGRRPGPAPQPGAG